MITLFRKISLIHAIKCRKTDDENIANRSFEKLDTLKTKINTGENIGSDIKEWMLENPTVSEEEIKDLNGGK
ncbi:hypothetical protein LB465_12575 [Salegentibacter sp. LM13S]|uniref:hypothetical protein n=1 Tax=Salegentibacter lacus TaxID=2873599 RepID=UPI001CCDBD75|nr:hypothetical protein [Salegentibacter lacus]MBZ9631617.1 hypothetical protein [Salegentibacter lacus]